MTEFNLNNSLVRLLTDDRKPARPVGGVFLAADRQILTCAHVVCDALGMDSREPQAPAETLFLDFPLLEGCPSVRAKVVQWHPVRRGAVCGETEDIAVLEVSPDTPLPKDARPAPLVAQPQRRSKKDAPCGCADFRRTWTRATGATAAPAGWWGPD